MDVLIYGVLMRLTRRQRDWAGFDRAKQSFMDALHDMERAAEDGPRQTDLMVEHWRGWDALSVVASTLSTQTIPSPWGGYDTETADAHIAAHKARLLRNLLPGRPGKVVLRGPIRRSSNTDPTTPGGSTTFSGGWVFGDKVLVADMSANPVRYVVIDWDPVTPSISAGATIAGLNVGLYPFHTRAGSYVYGFTAGAAGAPGSPSPDRRTSGGSSTDPGAQMLYWTGGNTSGDFVLLGAANHPRGAVDIENYLNRLFVLGGSVPGTVSPVFSNRLFWSNDLGDGTTVIADAIGTWQTGGSTNQIQLEGTSNDYGVALAVLNGRLLILRRQSTYMMTGTSPENFNIRRIASVGCIDPGSVLEWDDGIYFLSDTGLQFFDGGAIRPVSTPISGELAAASWQGTDTSELSMTRISSEHFLMAATGAFRRCWLYHVPSSSWAEITADTGVIAGVPRGACCVWSTTLSHTTAPTCTTSAISRCRRPRTP
jgi:hypothetical protein